MLKAIWIAGTATGLFALGYAARRFSPAGRKAHAEYLEAQRKAVRIMNERRAEERREREETARRYVAALSPEGQRAYFQAHAEQRRREIERLASTERKRKIAAGIAVAIAVVAKARGAAGIAVVLGARAVAFAAVEAVEALAEWSRKPKALPAPVAAAA